MEDRVGLEGLLFLGTCRAFSNRAKKRWITNSLFLCWLRASSHCRSRVPSLVKRFPSFSCSRCFSTWESPWEPGRSKASSTLEDTLLTCCPPAPPLRTALKFNSLCSCCLSNFDAVVDGLQRYVKKNRAFPFLFFWGVEEEEVPLFGPSFVEVMAALEQGIFDRDLEARAFGNLEFMGIDEHGSLYLGIGFQELDGEEVHFPKEGCRIVIWGVSVQGFGLFNGNGPALLEHQYPICIGQHIIGIVTGGEQGDPLF